MSVSITPTTGSLPALGYKSGVIAIAGRPNAGKSMLLNRILGAQVSIVTPKAQTTRERILGILSESRGQVLFLDTPGIHQAKEGGINEFMIHEIRQALDGVSLVWYIMDPASTLKRELLVLELLKEVEAPVFLLVNKSDIDLKVGKLQMERLVNDLKSSAKELGLEIRSVYSISALRGWGVKQVLEDTWAILPEGPALFPDTEQLSDRPTRFFVAEKVREQLFLQLGEELPYSCAVAIESFNEKVKPPRIEAIIYVERESQKGIVVGKGGQKIKAIGQAARKEIEGFLGEHVFLGLRVKVLKDWSKDRESLKRLGYVLPGERNST